jgi:hypothetical protein
VQRSGALAWYPRSYSEILSGFLYQQSDVVAHDKDFDASTMQANEGTTICEVMIPEQVTKRILTISAKTTPVSKEPSAGNTSDYQLLSNGVCASPQPALSPVSPPMSIMSSAQMLSPIPIGLRFQDSTPPTPRTYAPLSSPRMPGDAPLSSPRTPRTYAPLSSPRMPGDAPLSSPRTPRTYAPLSSPRTYAPLSS